MTLSGNLIRQWFQDLGVDSKIWELIFKIWELIFKSWLLPQQCVYPAAGQYPPWPRGWGKQQSSPFPYDLRIDLKRLSGLWEMATMGNSSILHLFHLFWQIRRWCKPHRSQPVTCGCIFSSCWPLSIDSVFSTFVFWLPTPIDAINLKVDWKNNAGSFMRVFQVMSPKHGKISKHFKRSWWSAAGFYVEPEKTASESGRVWSQLCMKTQQQQQQQQQQHQQQRQQQQQQHQQQQQQQKHKTYTWTWCTKWKGLHSKVCTWWATYNKHIMHCQTKPCTIEG